MHAPMQAPVFSGFVFFACSSHKRYNRLKFGRKRFKKYVIGVTGNIYSYVIVDREVVQYEKTPNASQRFLRENWLSL